MRTPVWCLMSVLAGALVLATPSTAPAVVVGINIDIHQDIPVDLPPNDFHIEGVVCSYGAPPVLVDHVDDVFPNFNLTIAPDPTGDCWYQIKADWSGAYIPFCTILHLGIFLDVDAENKIVDVTGWWTWDGQRLPFGQNGGFIPVAGFIVNDYIGEPRPPEGQTLRLLNGNQDGMLTPGEIAGTVVGMDVVPIPPGQLKAMLGPTPYRELRLGGLQETLPWVPVVNAVGPMSPTNPQEFWPDSFFDVFLEAMEPPPGDPDVGWRPLQPVTIEPGGNLIVRQLVQFSNNAGQTELRWAWEIHGAVTLFPEACCLRNGECIMALPGRCLALNGVPQGQGTDCTTVFCESSVDYGDAPEGALAYPASGVVGLFPTCRTVGPATWIQHTNFGAWFGPSFDFERDGNAGLCPMYGPYDADECFADSDAGLLFPASYTIDAANNVVPCPTGAAGSSLGQVCTPAAWGANIDIDVHNHMPNQTVGFVNVLIDWDQNGQWAGGSPCPSGGLAPEHVLVDFPIPNPFDGPLSALLPPAFLIGPNPGEVWMRVSITERPVGAGAAWDGSGNFEDGETEDYLINVQAVEKLEACCLPDGSCAMLLANDCINRGGAPQGAGSRCLGDMDGNGRDDLCEAKWVQLPDLSTTGMDVRATQPLVLADDWLCKQRARVTQIRIWGSWRNDQIDDPGNVVFTLSIHKDIPATPDSYSRPGEPVWVRQFAPGSFIWIPYQHQIDEGWYDPQEQLYVFPGDHVCWEYVFNIPASEAFCQEGSPEAPIVYWLDVQAQPLTPTLAVFGWKTSTQHWNDDAVWGLGVEPFLGPWRELRYPPGHPWVEQSIDLAFTISGDEPCEQFMDFGDAPEGALAYPATGVMGMFPTCKTAGPATWIQHTNFGAWFGPMFDLELDGNAGLCPGFNPYDADECFADGDAGLMFPASYTIDAANNVVPCPTGTAGSSLGQVCTQANWGTNIDIDVHNHMPNQTVGFVNVLIDWDQNGQWAGASACPGATPAPEHVLVNFPIPNPFDGPLSALGPPGFLIGPNPGEVWMRVSITERPVGIVAVWDGSGNFEDGETEDYLINVQAVEKLEACCLPDGSCAMLLANDCINRGGVPQGAGSRCLGDMDGDGRDDLCEAKWVQLPDLSTTGMDVRATQPLVLADDWLCKQRALVTQIRIWGSWRHDQVPDPGSVQFTLSIHKDIPATPNEYSRPGEPLWVKQFAPGSYLWEPYQDEIDEGWYDPQEQLYVFPGDHVCWEYVFNIPAREAFCQEGSPDTPVVYWLDVQAQSLSGINAEFGWKTSTQHWNDDAVWGVGVEPFHGPWNELRYPPEHPWVEKSIDLAFTISGDEPCELPMDFGDAPEGALAYPASGVVGSFPTCMTVGPATWIQHLSNAIWLGPAFDLELDGNAGLCPGFNPYNADECFADGDAGLLIPTAYTIDALGNVVPCPTIPAFTALGVICTQAVWGANVDIHVNNPANTVAYMNVLMDWDQNGAWGGASTCPAGNAVPEHVLVNFVIPAGYVGPLSGVPTPVPMTFTIGPNAGYVWTRFTISESPVPANWDGSGSFRDGETEDYLLRVRSPRPVLTAAKSWKTHSRPGTDLGLMAIQFYPYPVTPTTTATDPRSKVGVCGPEEVTVEYDVPISIATAAVTVTDFTRGLPIVVGAPTAAGNVLTIPFISGSVLDKTCLHIDITGVGRADEPDTLADPVTLRLRIRNGDVNSSATVTGADATVVRGLIIGGDTPPDRVRADVNCSGDITGADATVVNAKNDAGADVTVCP